jgi:hypothetical protein
MRWNKPRCFDTVLPLAILSIVVNLPNLLWALCDKRVWPWDQAFYGRVSLNLWAGLVNNPNGWLPTMLEAFGFKAPMIAWLGQFFVPIGNLLGNTEFALLLLQLFCSSLSIFLLGYISIALAHTEKCKANFGHIAALLILTASGPLFSGLTNQYFVEHLQLLSVVWLLLVFARVESRLLIALNVIANICFGLLVKISSPLYIAVPLLACLIKFIRCTPKKASLLQKLVLGLSAITLLMACLGWYYTNWDKIIKFMLQTSSGTVAELYGKRTGLLQAATEHWLPALSYSFVLFDVISLLLLALATVALALRIRTKSTYAQLDLFASLAVIQIVLTLVVFCLQINRETRYLLPLTPYIYLIGLFTLVNLPKVIRWILPLFVLHFVLVKSYQLGAFTEHFVPKSPWLSVLDSGERSKARLEAVVRRACREGGNQGIQIIASDVPQLNADSATFYAHKNLQTAGCSFSSLGHAETNIGRACERIKNLKPNTIVFDSNFTPLPSDKFNKVYMEFQNLLRQSSEVRSFSLRNYPEIRMYYNLDQLDCNKHPKSSQPPEH